MSCYRPVVCWKSADGPVSFKEVKGAREIKVKCGWCVGCRQEKRENWAVRCYAESKMHEKNSFVTLTYNEENYPQYGSLNYAHFQGFMRRLRKRWKHQDVRFFACGEYGDELLRPHFHALLFGVEFDNMERANSVRSVEPVYRSEELEKLWPYGFSTIGAVNFATATYCAAYICKKVTGDLADDHYSRVNSATGEIVQIEPEFAQMSLKPGIGFPWLKKYWPDIYSTGYDAVIVNGKRKRVPRYFDEKMDEIRPMLMDEIEYARYKRAEAYAVDNTAARLAVREQVDIARVNFNNERKIMR